MEEELNKEVRKHYSIHSCSEDRCNGIFELDETVAGTVIPFYLF
jgi:hypothetical protein